MNTDAAALITERARLVADAQFHSEQGAYGDQMECQKRIIEIDKALERMEEKHEPA